MSTQHQGDHHPWSAHHEHEYGETSSSLFTSAQTFPTAQSITATSYQDPEPTSHTAGNNPSEHQYHAAQYHNSDDESAAQQAKWTKDDIIMVVVLPIILAILLGFSLRHCYVANRRHAQFHERRQSIRAAQRADTREQRRLKEKKGKERAKEIEKALISKTASKCKCNTSIKKPLFGSMSDLTVHTDAMSTSSYTDDAENPAVVDDVSQTCAICLEPYVGGKDKVSWSKFQTCRHAFHQKCIEGWLAETKNRDGSCPICRGRYLKEEADNKAEENVQMLEEENHADEESPEDTNVHTPDEGEGDVDEGRPGNAHPKTPMEESSVDEERPIDANAQSLADGGVAPPMLEGDASTTTTKVVTGSEYTSFCIVHGLKRDKKRGNAFLSIKPIDEPPSLENV